MRAHLAILVALGCGSAPGQAEQQQVDRARERQAMVTEQIEARGVTHAGVLRAMRDVPRHEFVPEEYDELAYADRPLPIGLEQTISQPFIVALMTELVAPEASDRILEVGTGSAYQAAVAAELVAEVYSMELLPELAESAAERLRRLGVDNVRVRAGDGYLGWPQEAPFDGILVTAGADHVPEPLIDQLAPGARMVIPVGETLADQVLQVVEKRADGSVDIRDVIPVRFVPLRRR